MGKHGPCCHCGVTSTPLWQNGPPEKPILCNACGSRWRTKGTLVNYTPLHARPEHENLEDVRFLKLKSKEPKIHKRKFDSKVEVFSPDFNCGINYKGYDVENTSNRSSSGSAISNPESYSQLADASEFTASQHFVWDSNVPSRKRTCVINRAKPSSSVEKLTKDLYNIWHEQQSSCLPEFSEEDLLLESNKPMVSVEFGHGSVLIKHPKSQEEEEEEEEEESVACNNGIDSSSEGNEQIKNSDYSWDKDLLGTLQLLIDRNINLEDIVNFDNFAGRLANEEQQLLLRFLPKEDIWDDKGASDNLDGGLSSMSSLKSVFESPEFKVDLLSFKTLLEDGVFEGAEAEDIRVLKEMVLCDFTRWNWVERYNIFKDSRTQNGTEEPKLARLLNESEGYFRPQHDVLLIQNHSGQNASFNSQRGTIKRVPYDCPSPNDALLSSKKLFPSHKDSNGFDGSTFLCESSDNDLLLLDIPSNGSFPQAELLLPT